jgi:hypothetical protein
MKLRNIVIAALVLFVLYQTFVVRETYMNMDTTNIIIISVSIILVLAGIAYALPTLFE